VNEQQTSQRRGWMRRSEPRPHIRPPRSPVEIVCLLVTTIGALALLGLTVYWWPRLPAIIPTHFGIDGAPNAYGSKSTILFLPALLLLLTALFSALARYPWAFNYPVVITQENAARQYRRGRTLLAVVNAFMAALFAVIQWQVIQATLGSAGHLGAFFSPAVIVIFVVLVLIAAIALIAWWMLRGG
jgi:uncharacterized membrane protein